MSAIELSEEIYSQLVEVARDRGMSPETWIAALLLPRPTKDARPLSELLSGTNTSMDSRAEPSESSEAPSQISEARAVGAKQDFFSFAGAVDLGFEMGTDNDAIDADLAKAYAD